MAVVSMSLGRARGKEAAATTTYNEAKSEPGVGLDDTTTVVSAVVALAGDALVAFELLAKGMLATSEDDTHVGRYWGLSHESQKVGSDV